VSVNTKYEIIPPAFVREQGHNFYTMTEAELRKMVAAHYNGSWSYFHNNTSRLSEFSSWAASLHLVLCYASDMSHSLGKKDVHVAVMDTRQLEWRQGVLVWDVPDLVSCEGVYEYLAYGCIYGPGYKAVSVDDLEKAGVYNILPESKAQGIYFGIHIQEKMFTQPAKEVTQNELVTIKRLASLFGRSAAAVAVALLSIRPRQWRAQGKDRGRPTDTDMRMILSVFGSFELPPELLSERWISLPNMVNTTGFPDVQQWIDLLYALVDFTTGRVQRKVWPSRRIREN
jgi:hypothetical protein